MARPPRLLQRESWAQSLVHAMVDDWLRAAGDEAVPVGELSLPTGLLQDRG